MNILFINFIFYCCWFISVFKKEKKLTLYSFMIMFILVISFLGWLTVENGIYYGIFGFYNADSLTLEPYIYSFISYMLLFFPLRNIKKLESINVDFLYHSRKFKHFLMVWIIFIFLYTILKLVEALISISMGLSEAYVTRHMDGETLFEYNNFFLNQLNGKGYFILNATTPLIMVYSLIGLGRKTVSIKLSVFLIALCNLAPILSSISQGSRGGLFMNIFCLLFFLFIFKDNLTKRQKNKIIFISFLFVGIVLFYSLLITAERFANNRGSMEGFNSILRYFGEPFPNLGFRIWDQVINHPMGKRLFPEFFNSSSIAAMSINDRYMYWEQITGVPVINFKTYFGDLYIEYGLFNALCISIILVLCFKVMYKCFGCTIYTLPVIYLYFQLCVYSFAGFTKGGWHTIFQLIIIIILNIWIKYFISRKDGI